MPSRGQYWKIGGINDKHIVEADLDQALQDKINTGGSGDPDFLIADLSSDQTTNITVSNHIEFDTIIESNSLTLSTGSGQANGVIGNLKADTVYSFEAGLTIAGSTNSAELQYKFVDITGTPTGIGQLSNAIMVSSNSNVSFQPIVSSIHKTGGEITEVELQISLVNSVTAIESDFTYLRVIELTR